MKSHNEMLKEWQQDPKFQQEYNDLEEEFLLFDELLQARKAAGFTQSDVANRMGTKTSAIARLESGGGSKRHSPSVNTFRNSFGSCLIIEWYKRPFRPTPQTAVFPSLQTKNPQITQMAQIKK